MVLTSEGFINASVGYEDGMVKEVAEGEVNDPVMRGYVLPTFIDAHTHLADLRAPLDMRMPLEEVVAPPHGLKHLYLRNARPSEIARTFKMLSRRMARNGISRFIDFREGGAEGAKLLRSVGPHGSRPIVMGRPISLRYDREEVEELLVHVDGVGVSSMLDWDEGELVALAEHVVKKGKMFALHVSERVREDIEKVLDLRPSFIVHMTKATIGDMEACRDADVPIVVCPRSNMFFGNTPPLADMIKSGAELALGTDNAMISMPDMLSEIEFAARILRSQGVKDVSPVLKMAIAGGRLILNERDGISIEPGTPCDFMVIRSRGGDPFTDILLRSGERDVRMVCIGKRCWRGWR